ncbi:sugar ABC transporter ATP-binding protein [Rhizobium sp. Root1203]|uniref:ABC transporter ATP-binding protein n=1 Tax=Rhizobium sp. Root1203 TaxID=1736427 RepID=UPI00070903D8|nr:ABC transporter ATP-binding protein [Rhizobium sp. Root1203]KQV23626.1 sugar ABC transporter ATP-binding protein [Rhizobium sp. Root1203]
MSTIELRKVTKRFGSFNAVRNVDLSVAAGEVVCLLGPSGCGKTTTLRMIAGLERPTAGDLFTAGRRVNDLPPEKRNIAMVFQFYALYPSLSISDNIAMPLQYERVSREDKERRVRRVAEILQLLPVLDRKPAELSDGEKQRVAVARAIVRDPDCFLFDEPLSRLDVELRHSMRGQIKEVLSDLSKATVIVTHDQLEALTMADRIAIMKDGMVEQVGSPHDVFARPANVFVASFIGTPQMNLIEAEIKGLDAGAACLRLDGGQIRLAAPAALGGLGSPNVTVGVRPRAFALVAEADKETVAAQAELIEPMGAETLIHAKTSGGINIRVVVPREKRVRAGEAMHLRPDPKQIYFFDADGEAVHA